MWQDVTFRLEILSSLYIIRSDTLRTVVVEAREDGFGKAVLDLKVQPVAVIGRTIDCMDYLQVRCRDKSLLPTEQPEFNPTTAVLSYSGFISRAK